MNSGAPTSAARAVVYDARTEAEAHAGALGVTDEPTEITVVGGGTGALGRAVVELLTSLGRRVVIPARDPEEATDLPALATAVRCDLSRPEDVDALRAQVTAAGRWVALVNASGGYAGGAAHETSESLMRGQVELNLLGPWRLATAAANAMLEGGGGRIVNVLSRAATQPVRGQAAYQLTKSAMARLTEVMALELRDHGITVNAVLPSTMDTAANRAAMPNADHSRWVPLSQVAATIAWLLSTDAAIVSGALLPVYGRA